MDKKDAMIIQPVFDSDCDCDFDVEISGGPSLGGTPTRSLAWLKHLLIDKKLVCTYRVPW